MDEIIVTMTEQARYRRGFTLTELAELLEVEPNREAIEAAMHDYQSSADEWLTDALLEKFWCVAEREFDFSWEA